MAEQDVAPRRRRRRRRRAWAELGSSSGGGSDGGLDDVVDDHGSDAGVGDVASGDEATERAAHLAVVRAAPATAVVHAFCVTFERVLRLPRVDVKELEGALVEVDEDSAVLHDILQALLAELVPRRGAARNWRKALRRVLRAHVEAGEIERDPLNGHGDFFDLTPAARVEVLRWLCDWVLHESDPASEHVANRDAALAMMPVPLGADDDGYLYWHFGAHSSRVYRDGVYVDSGEPWAVAADSAAEIAALSAQLAAATSPQARALASKLVEQTLPELAAALSARTSLPLRSSAVPPEPASRARECPTPRDNNAEFLNSWRARTLKRLAEIINDKMSITSKVTDADALAIAADRLIRDPSASTRSAFFGKLRRGFTAQHLLLLNRTCGPPENREPLYLFKIRGHCNRNLMNLVNSKTSTRVSIGATDDAEAKLRLIAEELKVDVPKNDVPAAAPAASIAGHSSEDDEDADSDVSEGHTTAPLRPARLLSDVGFEDQDDEEAAPAHAQSNGATGGTRSRRAAARHASYSQFFRLINRQNGRRGRRGHEESGDDERFSADDESESDAPSTRRVSKRAAPSEARRSTRTSTRGGSKPVYTVDIVPYGSSEDDISREVVIPVRPGRRRRSALRSGDELGSDGSVKSGPSSPVVAVEEPPPARRPRHRSTSPAISESSEIDLSFLLKGDSDEDAPVAPRGRGAARGRRKLQPAREPKEPDEHALTAEDLAAVLFDDADVVRPNSASDEEFVPGLNSKRRKKRCGRGRHDGIAPVAMLQPPERLATITQPAQQQLAPRPQQRQPRGRPPKLKLTPNDLLLPSPPAQQPQQRLTSPQQPRPPLPPYEQHAARSPPQQAPMQFHFRLPSSPPMLLHKPESQQPQPSPRSSPQRQQQQRSPSHSPPRRPRPEQQQPANSRPHTQDLILRVETGTSKQPQPRSGSVFAASENAFVYRPLDRVLQHIEPTVRPAPAPMLGVMGNGRLWTPARHNDL